MTTSTHALFVETYTNITTPAKARRTNTPDVVIPFNPEWNNGTGYFDDLATADLGLPVGTRFATITEGENNRKIVGIVTPVGNVVFFERYTAGQNGVITLNLPRELNGLYATGNQAAEIFDGAVGTPGGYNSNIGQVLGSVAKAVLNKANASAES